VVFGQSCSFEAAGVKWFPSFIYNKTSILCMLRWLWSVCLLGMPSWWP
jgi:hypothetical protein